MGLLFCLEVIFMKLVILDSYTAVSTDLSLNCLYELCPSIEFYDRTQPEDIVKRIGGAELLLINKTPLTAEVLRECPRVKYIGLFATGYNNVDVDYCRQNGIVVSNAPSYSSNAVAQLVFADILHFYSMPGWHDQEVRAGKWEHCREFSFYNPAIRELSGKTIGLVGFGNIAKKVASIAAAFDMDVLVHTRTPYSGPLIGRLRFVPFAYLLENSDIVSLHCPLSPETERRMDQKAFSRMKPSAILINTARGGLIDEAAAANALNTGKIAGMAADVVSEEPLRSSNPLLHAKNCLLTPHIAWACRESRERLIQIVYHNLDAFLKGRPIHNVASL